MDESRQTLINCPHCGKEIALDDALSQRIRKQLQGEIDIELAAKKDQLRQHELRLQQEKAGLEEQQKNLEAEMARRIADEKARLKPRIQKELEEKTALELRLLNEQLEDKEKKIQMFRETEIGLRKEKLEIEDARKGLELEMARRMESERKRVADDTEKRLTEQYRMKEAEKDKIIDDLKKKAEEFKRKAEQGSQQLQGEVAEISLEELLKASFPLDGIDEVPKGIRGADVIHSVCNQLGQPCGTLIWESKRTKAWSDGWIEKLKEDQREVKAEIAVLVSTVLPKGVNGFARINGVWVCEHSLTGCLAEALRIGLMDLSSAKLSVIGKNEKMEALYEYLSGPEFRQHVEGIVEAFASMRKDLDQEKRAMEKIWAKREKQIERVIKNMGRMYGSMEGIIGQSLPQLELLELKALPETINEEA